MAVAFFKAFYVACRPSLSPPLLGLSSGHDSDWPFDFGSRICGSVETEHEASAVAG